MRSSMPPRASVTAFSLGTSSSTGISEFCRKTCPLSLTEMASGSFSWSSPLACVCGKSMGTPTVNSGADTMKMISSTSITSTIGVTLISLITARRPRRPRPPPPALIAIALSLPALVDLPRQDRRELAGKALQALALPVHFGDELVVENGRRDGGNQADCGRKQRLRDARRHHRQRGVFRRRDRLKAGHDAPDGPEQADEGAGRPHSGENQQVAFEPLHLARNGDVHHLLDAGLQAGKGTRLRLEAALPFPHRADKKRGHGMAWARRKRIVEFLQRLARPERLLELIHGPLGAAVEQKLFDRDGPYPDRADQQPDHHCLHKPMGLPKQSEQRYVGRTQARHGTASTGCMGFPPRVRVWRSGPDGAVRASGSGPPAARKPKLRLSLAGESPPTSTASCEGSASNLSKLGPQHAGFLGCGAHNGGHAVNARLPL